MPPEPLATITGLGTGGRSGDVVPSAPSWLTSVTVEGTGTSAGSNGYTLAIRGFWPASTFASFDLDPAGSPKVALSGTGPGFDRISGQAVANSARARTGIFATAARRQRQPNQALVDETDHGGGERTVRLALSRNVHPGDVMTVTFAAGWRAGLSGGVAAVTNSSSLAVQLPSFRWATLPNQIAAGAFDVDCVITHAHAEGKDAVAAVKFTATDGTNTVTVWAAAARVSPLYADSLKCWGANINPASGVPGALTAGIISVQAEIYPWIGAMRSTGTGQNTDTRSSFNLVAMCPLQVAYDPAGTRYPAAHVYVDTAGTTTPASVTVATTFAAAKAGTRAANHNVALQALYLANRSAAAANGIGTAPTRMGDNAILTFAAGQDHDLASAQNVTSGFAVYEATGILQGDPDDANPGANCRIRTASPVGTTLGNLWTLRNIRMQMGTHNGPLSWRYLLSAGGVTFEGKAGLKTNSVALMPATVAGKWGIGGHGYRWFGYGIGPQWAGAMWFGLQRNIEVSRHAVGLAIVGLSRVTDPDVTGAVSACGGPSAALAASAGAGASEDLQFWNIASLRTTAQAIQTSTNTTGIAGAPGVALRHNFINCLLEKIGALTDPIYLATGDVAYTAARDWVVEGCTFVGDRLNFGYDDPVDDATALISTGNCMRNNLFDWQPVKGDVFSGHSMDGNHSVLYSVEWEGNVTTGRGNLTDDFTRAYEGVRSVKNPVWGSQLYALYVSDQSANADVNLDGNADEGASVGGGDYRVGVGSPALARGVRACIDIDRRGVARGASWPAGSEGAS